MLSAPPVIENPIRAELFSVERLEQHAESLAAAQPVDHAGAGDGGCWRASRTTAASSASRIA